MTQNDSQGLNPQHKKKKEMKERDRGGGKWMKDWLIVLGFNDTSTLEGHFVISQRKGEKR